MWVCFPYPLPIDIIINGQLLQEKKIENSHYWFQSSLDFFFFWQILEVNETTSIVFDSCFKIIKKCISLMFMTHFSNENELIIMF